MKNLGHTGTLFKNGNKYRWSYKYEHCIICGNCDARHKGRGKCTKCFERLRKRNKELKHKNQKAYQERNKDNPVFKEYKNIKAKEFYQRNKDRIKIIERGKRRKAKGLECMILRYKDKEIYLPFDKIEKPQFSYEDNTEYKKRVKELGIIQKYLFKN